ncbi:hypothetical protein [Bosea thiooxidans]
MADMNALPVQQAGGVPSNPDAPLTEEELAHAAELWKGFDDLVQKDPTFMDRVGAVAGDIGTGVTEALPQAVRGAQEALNETSDVAFDMAGWLNKNVIDLGHMRFGSDASNGVIDWKPGMPGQNNTKFSESLMPSEPQSVTGGLVNDAAQLVTGFVLAGKYMEAAGIRQAATTGGMIVQGMAKGAIADATVFDPHEERISNLIQKSPTFSNAVTEFLAADPNDSNNMGRFKNAVEGMGLGLLADALLHGVRAVHLNRLGKKAEAEAALKEAEAAAPKVDEEPLTAAPEPEGGVTAPKPGEEGQLGLDLQGGGPRPDSPRETRGDEHGNVSVEDAKADIPPKKADAENAEFKPVKKIVEVSEDDLAKIAEASVNEKAWGQGREIGGIRTDLMETEADINSTMAALRVVYRKEYAKAVGGNAEGVRTWENVQRNADNLADLIGADPRLLTQRLAAIHKETFHADAELLLYRDMLVTTNERLEAIADVIADPLGGTGKYANRAEAYADFVKHYELLANMQMMYKGVQTNFARTMNAMKIVSQARKGILPDSLDEMFEGGPRQIEAMARRVKANKGNLKGNLSMTRGGFVNKFLGSVNEYWVNSILSGPKTHVANILGNTLNTVFQPAERMVAGAMQFDSPEGRRMFVDAGLQYVTMVSSLKDSFELAAKALKNGEGILDAGKGTIEHPPQISASNYNISDPIGSMAVNGIGKMVRVPSRLLTAEDEFFKQLNYRSHVRAQALREGIGQGIRDPRKLAELVGQRLDESVDATGAATKKDSLDIARTATFTNDLKTSTWRGAESWGETFQRNATAHPGLRLIMPFIRTPTNIVRFVVNHSPGINFLRKQYVDDMMGKNGIEKQGIAQAQLLTGAAIWTTAASHVFEGNITGAGPADPEVRKALERTGWRPYSIRIHNDNGSVTYRSFNRLDPFGMFFGLAADFVEAFGSYPEREMDENAMAVVIALSKNLSNKSYLSGLTNAIGAMADPGRRGEAFFKGLAAGFIPNAIQQTILNDPVMREARDIVDAMRRKTPGYSTELDPVRDILGEKQYVPAAWGPEFLSPIAESKHVGGPQPGTEEWKHTPSTDVNNEIARQMFLQNMAIKPLPDKIDDVDLTDPKYRSPDTGYTAKDRVSELVGTIRVNGKTLRETLEETFKSDDYVKRLSDGDYYNNGSRVNVITSVIQAYRQAATAKVRQEIPALHWDMVDKTRNKALMQLQPQARPAN